METLITLWRGRHGGLSYRYHRLAGRTKLQAFIIALQETNSGR